MAPSDVAQIFGISDLGVPSNPFPITISAVDPMLKFNAFTAFNHLTGLAINPNSPAAPGEVATAFMTGLGITNPPSPTAATARPFLPTAATTTVTLDRKPAQLQFAGF